MALTIMSGGMITQEKFLHELRICDAAIGAQQRLGEKKVYVLLQTLRFIKGRNVFLFCSDDFDARRGFADAAGIPCISIMSVFMKLKNMGMKKQDAEAYFCSYVSWCAEHGQKQVYVWSFHGSFRRIRRDFQDVFDGLYRNKFSLTLNGDLLFSSPLFSPPILLAYFPH